MEVNIKTCPDKICRTCLCESTELKSITSKMVGDSRTLLDALNFVVNINVLLGNGLPDQVCGVCETILYKADAFKRRCLESETVLGQHFPLYDQAQVPEELTRKSLVKDEAIIKVNKSELAEPLLPASELERPSNSSLADFIVHFSESDDKLKLFAEITASKQTDVRNNKRNRTEYEQDGLKIVKVEDGIDSDNDLPFDFDHSKSLDSPIELELKKTEINLFTCQCGTVCADKDKYRLHLYSSKCGHLKKSTKKRGVKIKSEKPVGSRPYVKKKVICPQCGKAFPSVKACNLHQKRYHVSVEDAGNYQCNMCQRKFNRKSSYTNHLKHHDLVSGVKYICDTCKREFQHKAHLDNHILNVHTRDEGFPCDECVTRFTTQASLDIHKESHKVEKKHICEICKKAFYMLSTLNDHMRVHTGEKPYLCSICGKGFSQKTNLAQHVRRHQGLKPFKCGDCDRSFVSKGELTAHARSHSGAHPFVCEDCGGGFTTSSSLVKHRRTHTGERPYACDLCPMRFAASGTLKNHRRTHTGEKPFQCSYCEKAFVQRHDLVSHIRGHTGERPYTCASCGMAFRKASALKAHTRLHNKEQRELALLQPAALLASLPAHPASDGGAQA